MNSMKDMDDRLNTLRVLSLIGISVLALYGHIYYAPFSAKWDWLPLSWYSAPWRYGYYQFL